jgi:hypothetical protein
MRPVMSGAFPGQARARGASRTGRRARVSLVDMNVTAPSAVQSATTAINRSLNNLRKDATVVANSDTVMSKDTIAAMIDSRQQVLYTSAAAKLISASDDMMASLLDVRA